LRAGVGAGHHLSVARCRLSGLRGAPRTRSTPNQDGYGFPPDPLAFRRPSGVRSTSRGTRPRGRLPALHALSCPFRDMPQQPRIAASPDRRSRRTDARPAPRCCLSWGFVPYDTVSDRWIRLHGGRSLCRRVPRARFGYLLRGLHHRVLPARVAPERPWASPSKVFPSSRWVPLSGSLPS
jgi:hypothetical protein